jgi:guanine deaminase
MDSTATMTNANGLRIVRGPVLDPRSDGTVGYFADGAIAGEAGKIVAAGAWNEVAARLGLSASDEATVTARRADGYLVPPLLDAHIHIPQHPIRGRFLEGVEGMPPEGPLLAGLNRNVFPAEGRCEQRAAAEEIVARFAEDTLRHGTIGGAAYMTVHAPAARVALERLPAEWSVGLVLMERNCPEYLRTDQENLERDVEELAAEFGRRLIVTDRFACAVDSPLRRRGAALAAKFRLRMQTHLNEQQSEKRVTEALFPEAAHYTDVYRRDGLLAREPILAHCIQMTEAEWDMLAEFAGPAAMRQGSNQHGAAIAHCPVSNTLLGSGIMPLDEAVAREIPLAICTDVGASPTTSLLAEAAQFLRVHAGRSRTATAERALVGITLAPARILGLDDRLGSFEVGKEFSFVEIRPSGGAGAMNKPAVATAEQAIVEKLLELSAADLDAYRSGGRFGKIVDRLQRSGLEVGENLGRLTADFAGTARRLDDKIVRVTSAGCTVWERGG